MGDSGNTGDKGKAIFPLNVGQRDGLITENNSGFDYDGHASKKTEAYMSTSVNPTFIQNNILYENSNSGDTTGATAGTNGNDYVNSANFMEIRKTSHGDSISNDEVDKVGNRLLPTTATSASLATYAKNRDETPPYKVKVYSSLVSDATTNRKFVHYTDGGFHGDTDYPASDEIGLDLDTYDYFILLNPEIISQGNDSLRPHFAKITRIASFDSFGDGVEFTPSYPTSIPRNTNLEIFKGPPKTDTDVVAVSYGLRGDNLSSTPKHDRVNICSRPTWFFYNDRLDEKDQLDYMTKYTATHLRWWNYSTTISVTSASAMSQFEIGSTSKYFVVATADWKKLVEGQSIWNNFNQYVGNIEAKYTDTTKRLYLDFARKTLSAVSSPTDFKIGKTVQNVVFRTQGKFNNSVPNIGKEMLFATLVDGTKTADDLASSDFYKWQTAFPNMHRHTGNLRTATTTTLDGNMTGPSKYLTFEKANFKNNRIPQMQNAIINNPRNKMSQIATFDVLDNHGLSHIKVQEEDNLIIQRNIHNDSFSMKEFEGTISNGTNNDEFKLSDIREEIDLRYILSTDDIVEIDGYYYVVNAVSAPSTGTQVFTIKDKKTKTANTWTGSSVAETVSQKKMYITPFTGVLNTTLEVDTELQFGNDIVRIDNSSVKKVNTSMYNARLVAGYYNSHDNRIDVGDRDNKFLRLQDADRAFYQRNTASTTSGNVVNVLGASRFYYYRGGYAISNTAFTGSVEDISSSAEKGLTKFQVTGRDDTSRLLSQTTSSNSLLKTDIIKSTNVPTLSNYVTITGLSSVVLATTSNEITFSGTPSPTPERDGILLNSQGKLIGEINTFSGTTITLYGRALAEDPSNDGVLRYIHPYKDESPNHITGVKALASNPSHSTGMTGFDSSSEKGLVFNAGVDIGATYSSGTATFTNNKLQGTSNTGTFLKDKTMGYDISSPKSFSTNDSVSILQIGDENGSTLTKQNIATVNSEEFSIVSVNEKTEESTKIEVAPIFPVLLGRVNSNTSDTRGNCSIYFVNNNANTGGFVHRMVNQLGATSSHYRPSETIRYWDLQRFPAGTITKTFDSIYNMGTKPQKIQGYAVGYGVYADGTIFTPSATNDVKPLSGSNTLNNWSYKNSFYGDFPVIQSYFSHETQASHETDIRWDIFEQIDPRADTYELLATGDLFPSSKLRTNNLGYHTLNYSSLGIMLESKAGSTGSTSHQEYSGTTSQTLKTDNNFEESEITSATQTTNNLRRCGVMRLVEATFDWHFNPIDFESLKKRKDIPSVNYFEYVTMSPPSEQTSTAGISSGSITGGNTLSATAGDVFYKKNGIGASSVLGQSGFTYQNDTFNGAAFVSKEDGSGLTINGTFTDNYGTVLSGANNTLKFDGDAIAKGVEKFKLFHTPDAGLSNLVATFDSTSIAIDMAQRLKDIRFHTAWLIRPNISIAGFEHKFLRSAAGAYYEPMNVILPLISEEKSGNSNANDRRFSAFHHADGWDDTDIETTSDERVRLHMSRVVAAIVDRSFSATNPTLTKTERYGLGEAHVYQNCIGLFKDWQVAGNKVDGGQHSDPLSLASAKLTFDDEFERGSIAESTYLGGGTSVNSQDQHTRYARVGEFTNTTLRYNTSPATETSVAYKAAYIGTKTYAYPLDQQADNSITHTGTASHSSVSHSATTGTAGNDSDGQIYNTQFIVKPTFDFTAGVTATTAATHISVDHADYTSSLTIRLNDSSTHHWLSFVPNLTNYYLVSEKLQDGKTIESAGHHGVSTLIAKITSHSVSTAPTPSAFEEHSIVLDRQITFASHGYKFRLMRISETTFEDTPDYIEFNVLQDTGLDYQTVPDNFRKGSVGEEANNDIDKTFQESVYSTYVLLDIDTSRTGMQVECRTVAEARAVFPTDGEKINMHITDGENSQSKTITIGRTRKEGSRNPKDPISTTIDENALTFNFDGDINGNGVVSFGEIFEIQLARRPKLKNIEKCHIGTTISISSKVENEVENLIKGAGLEYNNARTSAIPTGNIVSSIAKVVTGTLVNGSGGQINGVTVLPVDGVSALTSFSIGSVIYKTDGSRLGTVADLTATSITFENTTSGLSNNMDLKIVRVVCSDTVADIVAGDSIYNLEGHLIGDAHSVSSTNINMKQLFYEPSQHDELIKINQKTFVTNLSFENANLYTAINALVLEKGLDYSIKNGEFVSRNIEDTNSLRKYSLSYKESSRLISVKSNKSMFDKANKIVVVGDKVKFELEKPTKKQTRTVTVVDPSIKTRSDAQAKAVRLMDIYSDDTRKIQINVQKKGLELLEAGDIVRLNFPNHNIPPADYIVFEIENVLAGTLVITVGTFDKTIAERLSEINLQQFDSSATQFSKDSISVSAGKFIFDAIKLKEISVSYEIVGSSNALSYNSNMGFDDIVGFTEEVGFEHSTVTKKSFANKFYEQERYE